MSTSAMLAFCQDLKITHIDLSDNFLDVDGGKSFNDFLWTNSHLKCLRLTGCKLGKRTAELMLECWEENKNLRIEELYLNKNDFDEKSMKVLAKFFANMGSCEILDISENITVESS